MSIHLNVSGKQAGSYLQYYNCCEKLLCVTQELGENSCSGGGKGRVTTFPHSTQRWSLRSEVTQKTKVQGLTTETEEAKCCRHLVLMASADYRHSHSDLKPWPQDGKTLHGLQLLPYTYQCFIHTEVETMQFD